MDKPLVRTENSSTVFLLYWCVLMVHVVNFLSKDFQWLHAKSTFIAVIFTRSDGVGSCRVALSLPINFTL